MGDRDQIEYARRAKKACNDFSHVTIRMGRYLLGRSGWAHMGLGIYDFSFVVAVRCS